MIRNSLVFFSLALVCVGVSACGPRRAAAPASKPVETLVQNPEFLPYAKVVESVASAQGLRAVEPGAAPAGDGRTVTDTLTLAASGNKFWYVTFSRPSSSRSASVTWIAPPGDAVGLRYLAADSEREWNAQRLKPLAKEFILSDSNN